MKKKLMTLAVLLMAAVTMNAQSIIGGGEKKNGGEILDMLVRWSTFA